MKFIKLSKPQFVKLAVLLLLFFLIIIFTSLTKALTTSYKSQITEYSDFATPEELIVRNQILSMPWQKLNGPFGGQGYTIRFSPDNLDKIIVTDSFAGIHISSDRGLTWQESNEGIDARTGKSGDAIPVFVTAIDPNDSNKIWCGVRGTMGVFLSSDGGMSWTRKDNGLPDGENVEIRGLAVKPGDSNTIFAAGDLEEIGPLMGQFQRVQGIVYRTIDGGENWTQVLTGGNNFKDIIIDPNNTNTIYAASGFFDRQQLEKLEGVYKSTDGGGENTWTQINSGISNLYVVSLKFDPKNSNTIWGTTGMINQFGNDLENQNGAVIVSKDGGMSWTEAKRGRNNGATQIYSALGISPSNPNVIYASGFGIFVKSTDGGMNWTETGFGPLGSNAGHPIDIEVDPNNENIVFVDSYIGGVFKSTDGGKTWVSNAFGYSGAETKSVAVSPDGQNVFATSRSGVFLSQDKGVNWVPVGIGDIGQDELQAVAVHPADNNKILLGDGQNSQSSIFLSTDSGMIWKSVFMLNRDESKPAASTDLNGTIVFTDIKWSKSNPNIAYATCVKQSLAHDFVDSIGWGIFKSTDGGMSWVNKQNGIPGFKNTWSIDVDPDNESVIYIATNDSGILKSVDGGENWIEINSGLEDAKPFHSVSICPANTQVVLAGSEDGRIFRTTDGGVSWQSVFSDIRTSDNIVSIIFNPVASTHQVYAAANATGFYVSSDDGQTWQQYNNGLSMRELTGLAVTPSGDAVYLATNGGGIFRLPISGSALTLTRKQIETPSNAGIDAANNRNPVGAGFTPAPTTSSSGGANANPEDFSFTLSGKAAKGIKISSKKPIKTFVIVNLSSKSQESFSGKEVLVSTDFPASVIKITPSSFTVNRKGNKIKVLIQIKSKESLRDIISGELPNEIKLFLNLELEGSEIIKQVSIPLIYLN